MSPQPRESPTSSTARIYPAPRAGLAAIGLSVVIFAAVVAADFVTGWELRLTLFYAGPIALLAWRVGRGAALASAFVAGAAAFSLDLVSPLRYSQAAFLYWDGVANLAFFVLTATVVSRLRTAHDRLDRLSTTDPLTGLPNWRAFSAIAERELGRAARNGRATSLVYFDLDGFKGINDTHGHAEGDRVLAAVAKVLSGGRAADLAVRFGGDEFGVFMPETDSESAARAVERLRAALNEAMDAGGWHVRASYGVVTETNPRGASVEALVHAADEAMFRAKSSGKDRVERIELAHA